jgi:hypothetical protein
MKLIKFNINETTLDRQTRFFTIKLMEMKYDQIQPIFDITTSRLFANNLYNLARRIRISILTKIKNEINKT